MPTRSRCGSRSAPDSSPSTPSAAGRTAPASLVPAHAGDLLEIAVVAGRRFGNALRVEGVVSVGGEPVADVVLLLV